MTEGVRRLRLDVTRLEGIRNIVACRAEIARCVVFGSSGKMRHRTSCVPVWAPDHVGRVGNHHRIAVARRHILDQLGGLLGKRVDQAVADVATYAVHVLAVKRRAVGRCRTVFQPAASRVTAPAEFAHTFYVLIRNCQGSPVHRISGGLAHHSALP